MVTGYVLYVTLKGLAETYMLANYISSADNSCESNARVT
jgi:hypothetical protein